MLIQTNAHSVNVYWSMLSCVWLCVLYMRILIRNKRQPTHLGNWRRTENVSWNKCFLLLWRSENPLLFSAVPHTLNLLHSKTLNTPTCTQNTLGNFSVWESDFQYYQLLWGVSYISSNEHNALQKELHPWVWVPFIQAPHLKSSLGINISTLNLY